MCTFFLREFMLLNPEFSWYYYLLSRHPPLSGGGEVHEILCCCIYTVYVPWVRPWDSWSAISYMVVAYAVLASLLSATYDGGEWIPGFAFVHSEWMIFIFLLWVLLLIHLSSVFPSHSMGSTSTKLKKLRRLTTSCFSTPFHWLLKICE